MTRLLGLCFGIAVLRMLVQKRQKPNYSITIEEVGPITFTVPVGLGKYVTSKYDLYEILPLAKAGNMSLAIDTMWRR